MINLREWALPVYTIMMQMAAGTMLMLLTVYTVTLRRYGRDVADQFSHNLVMIVFLTVVGAMIGSHYHLSRPYLSLFAVMNFKSSWLSREITFTVAFAVLVGVFWLSQRYHVGSVAARLVVGWLAVLMGMVTVYCMAHVYLLPSQTAWNTFVTPVTFFSAALLLGNLAVVALLLMNLYLAHLQQVRGLELQQQIAGRVLVAVTVSAFMIAVGELGVYGIQIRQLGGGNTSAQASLDLLLGLYRVLFAMRLGLLGVGISMLIAIVLWWRKTDKPLIRLLTPVYVAFLFVLVSEVLGRFLFYAIHVRVGI